KGGTGIRVPLFKGDLGGSKTFCYQDENFSNILLAFSGIGAGVYAIVTSIEAVGLWYEKRWAHILVLGLVGISIPPEIYELIRGISVIKTLIFLLNLAVLGYLFRNFPKHPN
ncbi:DUF2127 domain-containing protein, partial [Nostoc sp. FACHB-888]|uniref:DUF2127 domain-containing protein n=1 Tax=Nostoc sp. FACHB-888 TaxID=2692842 RepID=UPI001689D178